MKKYFRAMLCTISQSLKERNQIFGRLIVFTVIIYLFCQIFESINSSVERIWYVTMTEGLILSTTTLVFQIVKDIQTNAVAYFLLRPVNYSLLRISEAIGIAILLYLVLMSWGILFLILLKGIFVASIFSTISSMLIGILSLFLYVQISMLIGLLSFWVIEIKTLIYFHLTAAFCFGGLIIPITYYPPLMQKICFCTPYPWILWWPGSVFSGILVNHFIAFAGWLGWSIFFGFLNVLVFERYKKALVMNGG